MSDVVIGGKNVTHTPLDKVNQATTCLDETRGTTPTPTLFIFSLLRYLVAIKSPEMRSLTSIPRELRDQILELVIQSHQNTPPALNQNFDELTQLRKILEAPRLQSWNNLVLNLPSSVIANTTNLLLVNRQLRAETLANIQRLNTCTYELDVMILDEILPLPTALDAVNVNFRISGSWNASKGSRRKRKDDDLATKPYARYPDYKGFRIGCGAGPAMGWQMYSILERFIKVGPVGETGDTDAHRHVSVKTLNINVETPQDVDPWRFAPPTTSSSRRDDGGAETVLSPTYLAEFVARNMADLLRDGDAEWFSYGKILYEHVDEIVITRDGKPVRTLDVAERLKDVGGFQERFVTKENLEEYKRLTWEERGKRGLRVLEQ
jgi:hypothetical protein